MGGWFSRTQAVTAKNNANTQVLKNALAKYIVAIKNAPNATQVRSIMNTNGNFINANGKALTKSYKNRIANGIAAAAYKAKTAVKAAQKGEIPETTAAAVVHNATANIKNLNAFMNSLPQKNNKGQIIVANYENAVNKGLRNLNKNRATNLSRPVPPGMTGPTPLYKNLFNSINAKRTSSVSYQTKLNAIRNASTKGNTNAYIQQISNQLLNKYGRNWANITNNKNSFEGTMRRIINAIENKTKRPNIGPAMKQATMSPAAAPNMFPNNMPLNAMLGVPHNTLNLEKRANLVAALKKKKNRANISAGNKTKINAKLAAIRGPSGSSNFMAGVGN